MSEALETLVDNYIKLKEDIVLKESAGTEDKEEYTASVKKLLLNQIYTEVEYEVRDYAIQKADKIIEKKADKKRINEFRRLTIDGLIVAFFVGLLVNQVTDIIGYLKGCFEMPNIKITMIFSVGLLIICIVIISWLFISEVIKMLEKEK